MNGFNRLRQSLRDSSMVVVLMPHAEFDAKIAVEIGLAILLDKPIVAVIRPGVQVSEKLARTVDHFIELDVHRPAAIAKALHDIVINLSKKDQA